MLPLQSISKKGENKMKKCLVMILCLLLCFLCTACGVSPEIEEKLKTDTWAYQDSALGSSFIQVYEFLDEGKYVDTLLMEDGSSVDNHGTYEIKKDEIVLVNEDGNEIILNYKYENGELTLFKSNGRQLYNLKK